MTMAAISLLSTPKSAKLDAPAAGTTAPDAATGFAAMMAGAAHPVGARGGAAQDARDAKPGKEPKLAKVSDDSADSAEADKDQAALDDLADADKDGHDRPVKADASPSTAILLGMVPPPVERNDDQGASDAASSTGSISNESVSLNVAVGGRLLRSLAPTTDGEAGKPSEQAPDTAELAPMLAALTDTLAIGAAARRAGAADPATDKADASTAIAGNKPAVGPQLITPLKEPASADVQIAAATRDGQPATSMRAPGSLVAPIVIPDAALQSVSRFPAMKPAQPTSPPILPATAAPLATATLLAARAAAVPDAMKGEARKSADTAHRDEGHASDADGVVDLAATAGAAAPVAAPVVPSGDRIAPASPSIIDVAGQQLSATSTDRQLDLARQGAWLDGISHDIAAAGASTGTVRFEIAPQHLGSVGVELKRDDNGASVTLTTGSEATRAILSDATPQLVAEARAHGLHIANAQVDVGTGNPGSGGQSSPDSQGRPSNGQPDGRHAASQNTGFSTQTGTGGDSSRQSQTRSQPLPEYRSVTTRTDRGSAGEAKASVAVSSARASDARYA